MKIPSFGGASLTSRARVGGFYVSVIAFVAMWLLIFAEGLVGVFRTWSDPSITGSHFVHGATFMTMIWILGLAMLAQLYRAARRVPVMQVALTIVVIALLVHAIAGTLEPMLLVFFAPIVSAALLHPARDELLSRDAVAGGAEHRVLLALAGLALVPVLLYANGQVTLQMTLVDDHAADTHYGSMATYVVAFVGFVVFAAVCGSSRRFVAYAAAVMAAMLAASSLYQPTVSAIDGTWSVLAILWAVAVVAAYEWSVHTSAIRRGVTPHEDLPVEESGAAR